MCFRSARPARSFLIILVFRDARFRGREGGREGGGQYGIDFILHAILFMICSRDYVSRSRAKSR